MEENTITMQALVMAHACYGHNSFFKKYYLSSGAGRMPALSSPPDFRNYITRCEERYGVHLA